MVRARKFVCSMCHRWTLVEEKTKLCPECFILKKKKQKMMTEVMADSERFLKKKMGQSKEGLRKGEANCRSCGQARPIYAINSAGLCGKCQVRLNKIALPEEVRWDKKRGKAFRSYD